MHASNVIVTSNQSKKLFVLHVDESEQ